MRRPVQKHHTCTFSVGHAFLYGAGKLGDLGALSTAVTATSEGEAINDSGEVVGSTTTSTGVQAFIDQSGTMTAIGLGNATAVNDAGTVAGSTTSATGSQVAFSYSNGKMTDLGLIPGEGGLFSDATGINSSNQIIGVGDNAASDERAWLYSNGKMADIGTFGGPQAAASAINDSGEIVGFAQTSSDADHGFLYNGGKMTDLGLNIFPTAINDAGAIVGQTEGAISDTAFVYSAGKAQNLNTLIPPGSNVTLTNALGINEKGQIVAEGTNTTTGLNNAYLLNPV